MKTHTSEFKNKIKEFGREIDSKITYTTDGVTTELGGEELNSVSPHYEGAILKSVMKQLDIDSNVEIPIGTELNYKFGVKTRNGYNLFDEQYELGTINSSTGALENSTTIIRTTNYQNIKQSTKYTILLPSGVSGILLYYYNNNTYIASRQPQINNGKVVFTTLSNANRIKWRFNTGYTTLENQTMLYEGDSVIPYEPHGAYDYVDYGNYIVKDVEKQEDTYSYKITCYDKMLYSMKDYENSNITFPITVKNYLIAICNKIGLTFKDSNFANYDKIIDNELYLDNEGRSLGYTFRTILDEIAQVSGGTICITDDDKLEVRYLNQTVGKNLLGIPNVNYNGYGLNIKSGNGLITITGTTTSTIVYDFNLINPISSSLGTLTKSVNASGTYNGLQTSLRNNSGDGVGLWSDNGENKTNTISADAYKFRVQINSGITINTTFKPQIEIGSSATVFEPYGDTIDEEYLKDINVNFGEKFGPVNTIVLSRGGDGDKISLSQPTNLPDTDKIAIQITDNQIMNGNNRDTYLSALLNKLYGLEYYINDFSSTGICYLDLCDKYNIKIGDKFYNCIMFNDEVNITQGLEELIYTDMQEENEQDYKYIGSTDRGITQANIIANKAEATITSYTQRFDDINNRLNAVEVKQTETDVTIGILGTNIDDDGNITAVKVKEGYTFDENGFQIYTDANSFKTLIDETGTYYYDGTTKVGQYTKDGSKQKDLELFGVYYYGKKIITDDAMFVAQLYNDNDGEEGFGHFYNRGD